MAREGWRGRSTTNTRRPRARGDPYAAAHQLKDAVRRLSRNNNALWLWVPAFAGTTMRTHLRIPAAQYARSCARISRPENKGRGECRVLGAPAAPCATKKHRGRSHRFAGTPGIPARNGFNGFLRDLPGDRALFVTVASENFRRLDASVEASGPHDFAVRITRRSSKAHPRPPHPVPTSVTIAKRPSCGSIRSIIDIYFNGLGLECPGGAPPKNIQLCAAVRLPA